MKLPYPFFFQTDDVGRDWLVCKDMSPLGFSKLRELISFAKATDKDSCAVVSHSNPKGRKLAELCGFTVHSSCMREDGPAWLMER